MDKELERELEQRGTAEISNGIVTQVTQAIDETPTEASFMMFGELKKRGIIPIEEACAKCDHCYFPTTKQCQEHQKKDAEMRGFNEIVCPSQFK